MDAIPKPHDHSLPSSAIRTLASSNLNNKKPSCENARGDHKRLSQGESQLTFSSSQLDSTGIEGKSIPFIDIQKNKSALYKILRSQKKALTQILPFDPYLSRNSNKNLRSSEQMSKKDEINTLNFVESRLHLINETKKTMKSEEQLASVYFKVFQEVIDHQSKSLISSLLQEIKTGLYECMNTPSIPSNAMDGLNEKICQIKAQLQEEQESSKVLKNKFEQVEERLSRR